MKMGEVVVSSDEVIEVVFEKEPDKDKNCKKNEDKDGSSEVVRWEKFLPRMMLRVLLVEADDSTRQIIAALLRKCSYRVAAVPDGLMAWETLKGRPQNIDIILTEVELPSISGFALLTLVMEHDACKNIPVIMMSSHDSVSMVLKCMLKGAADFLIKPIRRNELRNIWMHVWRRNTLSGGSFHQSSPIRQPKVECTSENTAASNYSSDHATSAQKNKECSEKGSDALGLSQLKYRTTSILRNNDQGKQVEHLKPYKQSIIPECKTRENFDRLGTKVAPCVQAYRSSALKLEEGRDCCKGTGQEEGVCTENDDRDADISVETHGCNDEPVEPSNGAVDLIGTFDDHQLQRMYRCSNFNDYINKSEFAPQLELSLTRFCPSSSMNKGYHERHTLNHSNASAFSWYNNNKLLQSPFSAVVGSCTESKEKASKTHEPSSYKLSQDSVRSSDPLGAPSGGSQGNIIGQSRDIGLVSVSGVTFDSTCAEQIHVSTPIFYSQSGLPPQGWNAKPAFLKEQSPFPMSTSVHSDSYTHDAEQGYHLCDETIGYSVDQAVPVHSTLETVRELKQGSPAAGQSTGTSLYNSVTSHDNSDACGGICRSDGNGTSASAVEKSNASEILNEGSLLVHNGLKVMESHRSSQREAALTKFRLKRKERCYEKKVRYQSRKRLAEQRPRVKGQFVRQVQNDTPATDAIRCP